MKVYILVYSHGCKYEGGSDDILGVFSTKKLAYDTAKEHVPPLNWKETDDLFWEIPDGDYYNIWTIEEWEVK